MMLFAKFLFPFVRFSWSLSLIEFGDAANLLI